MKEIRLPVLTVWRYKDSWEGIQRTTEMKPLPSNGFLSIRG